MLENIYKLLYKIKQNKVVNKLMKLPKSPPINRKSTPKHNSENNESNEDFIDKATIDKKQIMLEKLIIRQARRKIEHS